MTTLNTSGRAEVTIGIVFDEPVIGRFASFNDEKVIAVEQARVVIYDGQPSIPAGAARGRNVRRDNSLGGAAIAYGFRFEDVPSEVKQEIAQKFHEIMSAAALTLDI